MTTKSVNKFKNAILVKNFFNALKRDLKNIKSLKHHSNADGVAKLIDFSEMLLRLKKEQTTEYLCVDGLQYNAEMLSSDVEGFMSSDSWDSLFYSLNGYTCKRGKGFTGIFTNLYNEVF